MVSARSAAIASRSLRRCPSEATPSSFSSSAVRFLVLSEAKAPKPDDDVHEGAHNQWWRASSAGAASVSRVALMCFRGGCKNGHRPTLQHVAEWTQSTRWMFGRLFGWRAVRTIANCGWGRYAAPPSKPRNISA